MDVFNSGSAFRAIAEKWTEKVIGLVLKHYIALAVKVAFFYVVVHQRLEEEKSKIVDHQQLNVC